MGRNFYIVPNNIAQKYTKFYNVVDKLEDSYNTFIRNISVDDDEGIIDDEIVNDIQYRIYGIIKSFSKIESITHIGRRTNQTFIWNIDPTKLNDLAKDSIIVNETWNPNDDSGYTIEEFLKEINVCTYDLSLINTKFS